MDDFWQQLNNLNTYAYVTLLVTLVLLYLVIRLAVMHALRDHSRWEEGKRVKATRTTYPDPQRFPPITPESHEGF